MPYRKIHCPVHARCDSSGFIGEHIVLVEKSLGRSLSQSEVVHHKDFNKTNNMLNNLQHMTRREHQQMPLQQARFLVARGLMDTFFEWWQIHRYTAESEQQRLESKIVVLQNKAERMQVKLEKGHASKNNHQ